MSVDTVLRKILGVDAFRPKNAGVASAMYHHFLLEKLETKDGVWKRSSDVRRDLNDALKAIYKLLFQTVTQKELAYTQELACS